MVKKKMWIQNKMFGKQKVKDQSEFKWKLVPRNSHDADSFFYLEVP